MKNSCDSFFKDFTDRFAAILREKMPSMTDEQAWELAKEAANALRKEWAGEKVYIPKREAEDMAARNMEIWNRFDGSNSDDLCREYDLTISRLYQIVRAVDIEMKRKEKNLDGL